jgi:hypothetical protein
VVELQQSLNALLVFEAGEDPPPIRAKSLQGEWVRRVKNSGCLFSSTTNGAKSAVDLSRGEPPTYPGDRSGPIPESGGHLSRSALGTCPRRTGELSPRQLSRLRP